MHTHTPSHLSSLLLPQSCVLLLHSPVHHLQLGVVITQLRHLRLNLRQPDTTLCTPLVCAVEQNT